MIPGTDDAGEEAPPSAAEPRRLYAPGPGRLPPVDERIAPPETRVEYIRGIELYAAPADEPHGGRHFDLTYVLGAGAAARARTAGEVFGA